MIRHRPIPLIVQLLNLRKFHPEGCGGIIKIKGVYTLVWKQKIRPEDLGALYDIELSYALADNPRVLAIDPNLRDLAGGRKLPHVFKDYNGVVNLCLCKEGDWRSDKLLATTLIPWTAEWFLFFEYWLYTGEWLGGGTHPTTVTPPKTNVLVQSIDFPSTEIHEGQRNRLDYPGGHATPPCT